MPQVSSMKVMPFTRYLPVLSAGFLLAACGAPSQVTLPDGTLATRIDCGASAADMNYCFEKAGKSCGAAGYEIVGPEGELLGNSEAAAADSVRVVRAWRTDANSIYIRCGT